MRNIKLNLLKGVACISVVLIHVGFPGVFGEIVLSASHYAVPIFFMIAGYYAFGKGTDVIKRRLIKILKIFICTYILFFIWKISVAVKENNVVEWLSWYYNWKTPIRMIFFCLVDFASLVWYLLEMVEIYLLWILIVKKGKEDFALKTLPVLLILRILFLAFHKAIGLNGDWSMFFIIKGMPWFLMGYFLRSSKSERIRTLKSRYHCLWAIVGCLTVVSPAIFDLNSSLFELGYIPYAFGLFCLTLKNPEKSTCKFLEYIGEKLSLYVYVLHLLVAGVYNFVFELLGGNPASKVFIWSRPLIVILLTLAISLFVSKMKLHFFSPKNVG